MRSWLLVSMLLVPIACDPASDSGSPLTAPVNNPVAKRDLTPDDLERLTALGYLDFAPEPADAEKSGASVHADAAVAPGLTLYTNHRPCRAVLMDRLGREQRVWSEPTGCTNWVNTRLLRSGELLVIEGKGGLALHARDGRILWSRRIGAHHDANPMPDGRFAVLLHENRRLPADGATRAQISPDGVGPPLPQSDTAGTRIIDDLIAIVTRDGLIVEQQSIFDLLDADASIQIGSTDVADRLHTNSIEWMGHSSLARESALYSLDNVLVSIRNQDRVAIIDWKTRRIVWSWGPGVLDNQHDASLLDSGHILLFDNGLRRGWSRVLEVDPRTNEIVWEYGTADTERFFSKGRGAAQRLPNGNTLISVSDSGYAIEVTPKRRIVWEFHNPITVPKGESQHRVPIWVRRYPPGWAGLFERPTESN